jgi:hypothetical protein
MPDQNAVQEIKELIHIVNGEEKRSKADKVSYEEIVAFAYPTPPSPNAKFTVTYRNAEAPNREGSLVAGQFVVVREKGTVFNVTPTVKS